MSPGKVGYICMELRSCLKLGVGVEIAYSLKVFNAGAEEMAQL